MSRRRKLVLVGLLVVLVFTVFFMSHYVQLSLMERVSLRTFIVRMVAASQNLNTSSPMYGSYFNSSVYTVYAVDVLSALGGLGMIDSDALLHFIVGPDQAGPMDWPMQDLARYNARSAFLVSHVASVIGRLGELPRALVDKIHETIIVHQNSSSKEDDFWQFDRTFLFETARLMNETRYVNSTFQKQQILDDIVDEIGGENFKLFNLLHPLKGLQELRRIEIGQSHIGDWIPASTRNMLEFYILSLWDGSRYGFYDSLYTSSPKYYEGSLEATYEAVWSYTEVVEPPWGYYRSSEQIEFQSRVGQQFENVLTFLGKCQNRYGIFFDTHNQVNNTVNSLRMYPIADIWETFSAVMLLNHIGRMDFFNQTVRWPPNPTLIENLGDRFSN